MLIGIDASRAFTKERTGTENYTWQLLLALAKLECEHSFRVYTKGNSKFEYRNSKQYLNSNLFGPSAGGSDLEFSAVDNFGFKIISWPYLWTQGALALETWRRPVDTLFIPAHVIPFLKSPKVPTIVTVHDLGFEFLPWYQSPIQRFYLSKIIEKLRSRLATHIIAVSKSTKKDLIEKLGVPEEKITVVYEGIDRGRFAAELKTQNSKLKTIKKKYKIEGDYILFVGTIQPRKNIARLVEAFKKSQISNLPPKARFARLDERERGRAKGGKSQISLIIVGKRGWSADGIYETPKRFGIADKVKFLDYVTDEDLPALYAGARIFCLPSLHEGFGLPVLEAMASGVPVIASNVSSLPEVVGSAGLLVDPQDISAIAEAMKLIIKNEKLKKELVEKGFKQAQKFSWEKCAKETMEVFERIAGHHV